MTDTLTTPGDVADVKRGRSHSAILLIVLSASNFMTGLDLFIVNVALRPIGEAFKQRSLADLSWILNGYAIVFAALLVPAGRMADRYGAKRLFAIGLALFTAGSLGSAVVDNLWLLVALRCLQAIGAAALVPSSLGLILTSFSGKKTERAIQIWAIASALGAALGPVVGGLLVEASWRWIFIINVPIGIAAVVITIMYAPNKRHGSEKGIPDMLGGALLMIGIAALALALVQGPNWGWGNNKTIVAFAVTVVALLACLGRSAKASQPVIDLALFRNRTFAWGNIASFAFNLAFGIQLLGLVLWMQEGWGWSAITTGLAIAPGPIMVPVTAMGLTRYTGKMPVAFRAALGAVLMGAGGAYIAATLTVHPNYAVSILPGWLAVGFGVGLAVPTLISASSADLAPHQTSSGSAIVQMGRQIGSVIGIAILIVVVGSATVSAGTLHRFNLSLWYSAGFAVIAAITALPLLRHSAAPADDSEQSAGAERIAVIH